MFVDHGGDHQFIGAGRLGEPVLQVAAGAAELASHQIGGLAAQVLAGGPAAELAGKAAADRALDEAWRRLTGGRKGQPLDLVVKGHQLHVPRAAMGVARFAFHDLCGLPLGAVDYLSKPVDADDVAAALLAVDNKKIDPPENPMSADRVRWEHIQRIYEMCNRNVSETARRLNMHRRTLQRILAKRAPR